MLKTNYALHFTVTSQGNSKKKDRWGQKIREKQRRKERGGLKLRLGGLEPPSPCLATSLHPAYRERKCAENYNK